MHSSSVVPDASTSKYLRGRRERQRIAHIIAENCAAKYRVPTMLDGPVVDTHIFAFESCAA